MKFHCGPSKEVRRKRKIARLDPIADRLQRWTPWFAWYPVRVDEGDCRFMETVERRYKNASVLKYDSGRVELIKYSPDHRAVAWPEDGM